MAEGVKRPILGHGIDFSNYISTDNLDPHNDYVRFFVEQGILGVIVYFGSYLCVLMHAVRNVRRFPHGSLLKKLAVFLICYIPSYLLMSVSENLVRYLTIHWYVWAIIGVYYGLIMTEKESKLTDQRISKIADS